MIWGRSRRKAEKTLGTRFFRISDHRLEVLAWKVGEHFFILFQALFLPSVEFCVLFIELTCAPKRVVLNLISCMLG